MKLQAPASLFRPAFWSRLLQFIAFAALLFGIRLWVIGSYGNATPYWDQWDAEADNLYKRFFSGTLRWWDMFSVHANHRIFTTRLLDLTLLKINGLWNPMLQMVVNAGLHIGTLSFGIYLLMRVIGRQHLPALLLFSLILFGIPFAWENILCGFQCQFYFLLFFSFASLWLLVKKDPFTIGWWGGLICAVLAFFSLASGVFVFATAAISGLIIYFYKLRRTPKQLISIAILSILFFIFIKITPSDHESISFKQFYISLITLCSWPISTGLFSTFFRNLPAIIFVILIFRKPPPVTDKKWFLLALIVWSAGQAFAIAYGRTFYPLSSRYLDLYGIAVLTDFACLIFILQTNKIRHIERSIIIAGLWAVIVLFSLLNRGALNVQDDLARKHHDGLLEEMNTRNYLATGDTVYLKRKERLAIPYPDPDRLALILSWPEIRKILPSNINPGLVPTSVEKSPGDVFVRNGYYSTTTGYLDSAWGSYNLQGDTATGNIALRFDNNQSDGKVLIPVAGYPLADGIKLEIEQNGEQNPIAVADNPKEKWIIAEAKLKKGPFTIYASDSSKNTWLAVGKPVLEGRLDSFTNWMLSHYFVFLIAGVLIIAFLVTMSGFRKEAK